MSSSGSSGARQTQRGVILAYLRDIGSGGLTQSQALVIGGGSRLAAHILELRRDGWNIETEYVEVPNVLGGISRVGRYRLGTPERYGVPLPMKQLTVDGREEELRHDPPA